MNAFLFPGQGEECPMMASYYLQQPSEAGRLLSLASQTLRLDLQQIIMRGSPQLAQTEVLQPALTAISIGLALTLQQSIQADAVAGHSLGEVSAAAIAGCLNPEQAISLSIERGRHMALSAKQNPGAMVATTFDATEAAANEGVELAAENAPTQWVYTGDKRAIEAFSAKVPATKLPVAGAWHSRLMLEAQDSWRRDLREIAWREPRLAWFCNRDGARTADAPYTLEEQLTRPVRWVSVMKNLWQDGHRNFYLIGPSRALKGLCRANLPPEAKIITITGKRDIAQELV